MARVYRSMRRSLRMDGRSARRLVCALLRQGQGLELEDGWICEGRGSRFHLGRGCGDARCHRQAPSPGGAQGDRRQCARRVRPSSGRGRGGAAILRFRLGRRHRHLLDQVPPELRLRVVSSNDWRGRGRVRDATRDCPRGVRRRRQLDRAGVQAQTIRRRERRADVGRAASAKIGLADVVRGSGLLQPQHLAHQPGVQVTERRARGMGIDRRRVQAPRPKISGRMGRLGCPSRKGRRIGVGAIVHTREKIRVQVRVGGQ